MLTNSSAVVVGDRVAHPLFPWMGREGGGVLWEFFLFPRRLPYGLRDAGGGCSSKGMILPYKWRTKWKIPRKRMLIIHPNWRINGIITVGFRFIVISFISTFCKRWHSNLVGLQSNRCQSRDPNKRKQRVLDTNAKEKDKEATGKQRPCVFASIDETYPIGPPSKSLVGVFMYNSSMFA